MVSAEFISTCCAGTWAAVAAMNNTAAKTNKIFLLMVHISLKYFPLSSTIYKAHLMPSKGMFSGTWKNHVERWRR
jgi:hypothetical protein